MAMFCSAQSHDLYMDIKLLDNEEPNCYHTAGVSQFLDITVWLFFSYSAKFGSSSSNDSSMETVGSGTKGPSLGRERYWPI